MTVEDTGVDTGQDTGRDTVPRVPIDRQHRQVYRAQSRGRQGRAGRHPGRRARPHSGGVVNIRVSQLNRCAYCLHVHVRDALAGGETTQRIAVLPAWRDTTLFSDTERAALTL